MGCIATGALTHDENAYLADPLGQINRIGVRRDQGAPCDATAARELSWRRIVP